MCPAQPKKSLSHIAPAAAQLEVCLASRFSPSTQHVPSLSEPSSPESEENPTASSGTSLKSPRKNGKSFLTRMQVPADHQSLGRLIFLQSAMLCLKKQTNNNITHAQMCRLSSEHPSSCVDLIIVTFPTVLCRKIICEELSRVQTFKSFGFQLTTSTTQRLVESMRC